MVTELKGDERTYQVDLSSTNAMCRIEEATGLTYADAIAAIVRNPRVTTVRKFFQGALVAPPETIEEVGIILDDIGGVRVIVEAAKALTGRLPEMPTKGRRRRV